MNAQDLYLELQKRPQAVSATLRKFGINIPRPNMNDVLNAFILHETSFANELGKNLGYSSFDGSGLVGLLDDIVSAAKGVSVIGTKAKEAITKQPETVQVDPKSTSKIMGIEETMFYVLLAALVLVLIFVVFR